MSTPTTSPRTKPQPVVVLGSVVAGLTATTSALTIIFKDNPTVILALGVVGAVVTGVTIAKDQYVKSVVVPLQDTATYVNQEGQTVAGPASPLKDGTVIGDALVATGTISAGVVEVGKLTADGIVGDGQLATAEDLGDVTLGDGVR